jgi:hypothetical protein
MSKVLQVTHIELAEELSEEVSTLSYDCSDTEQAHTRIDKLAEAVRHLIAALKVELA